MPALRPTQIADFVEATLEKFHRDAWVDISLDLQDYAVMSTLLQGNKVGFEGGEQLQWQVKVQNTGAARNTALYDEDQVSVADVLKSVKVPWTFQTTNFSYDEREPAFQSGPERIVDLIKLRRHAALNDLVELLETNFWSMPADSTTDSEQLKPFGVPYWVHGTSATSSFGFNGGNPPNFSSGAGGLSSTSYPNWANGNATYSAVTKEDLVRVWREAFVKCKFRAPNPHPTPHTQAWRHAHFTNYNVLGTLEEILEDQNDDLGNDVASKDGMVKFRSTPVMWVPYLDQNTITDGVTHTDPIFGLDLNVFKCVFKTGEFMKSHAPQKAPHQHRVRTVHIDTMQQFICYDRRRNYVLYKA